MMMMMMILAESTGYEGLIIFDFVGNTGMFYFINAVVWQIRVNCLVCLGKILEHLDRWYVMDEVLPMLQQIPSREPAVLMSMLGIKCLLCHFTLSEAVFVLIQVCVPALVICTSMVTRTSTSTCNSVVIKNLVKIVQYLDCLANVY